MEIGIVGKPNVGKSTFFKALTLKEAEIADFPFTTIKPNIGVGYVRSRCAENDFGLKCKPNNSFCIKGNRFIPVKMIDVAGLVPGAHEGRGLGNQFLDDLRRADVLIHVVDISGRTDENGEKTVDYDPGRDIRFLVDEIDHWFFDILKRNWSRISGKIRHSRGDMVKELCNQLAGLGIHEPYIKQAVGECGLDPSLKWDDSDLRDFAMKLRENSKPILIAANKIDLDCKNYERLREEYDMIPVCSEAELALRQAQISGIISYIPGDEGFIINGDIDAKQKKALGFIQEKILKVYGSTGVQECLDKAVLNLLDRIVVYPVENENRLTDKNGNILPDAYLLPRGSTTLDLAYKIHTDIGDKFIGAIDCKTKRKVGRDHILGDGDVIKVITRR